MLDDAGLLEVAQRGDPEALGRIFDLHAPALYRYAVRLCHDPTEADHIVGDVFAQLVEQIAAGRGPRTNLRAYLYQIAYHGLVDRARQAARVSPMEEAAHVPDGQTSVPGQVERSELVRELERALAQGLTEEQQHVLMLRFVEGFSLQETAEIMDKKANAVSVLQNRAITKLRQLLQAEPDAEK